MVSLHDMKLHMGICKKKPDINQMVFADVIVFFPLIVFPGAGFTPSSSKSYCGFFGGCQLPTTSFTSVFFWKILYLQSCDCPTQNNMQGICKTRCTSSKVGSVSHGPFLTPEVFVFIIVLLSFWSTCHMLQTIKISGNPSTR